MAAPVLVFGSQAVDARLGVGHALAGGALIVGLTLFLVWRLVVVARRVQGMRIEAAQLAVARERQRFAQDLHDLLGPRLLAVALRTELAQRRMRSDVDTASDELRTVIELVRTASIEARQLADGYRDVSLSTEVQAASSLLASADVKAHLRIDHGCLPRSVDSALAIVLRESTANVVRHSRARNCWITAENNGDRVTLSVANDGVSLLAAPRRVGGLENLTARIEAIGGTLSTTVRGDGCFRVLASSPCTLS